MKNLIIGNTSQLSNYFPKNYERISSRGINVEYIIKGNYNRVYILFAEQRTFLNESEKFFIETNALQTISLIDKIKNYVNEIVIYSTSELWNNYEGDVYIENDYNYNYSPYIKSKQVLCDTINEKRNEYKNVIIIYPFNFNSPYRKEGFLFSKIFDSIINKTKIIVGDLNFNRDIIHPKVIVQNSIDTNKDLLIGSGELIQIETYIKDLFDIHNMNYKDYITTNSNNNLTNIRKDYYSGIKYSNYNELLKLTKYDIKKNTVS